MHNKKYDEYNADNECIWMEYGFMYQDINNINEKISIVKDVISLN